MYQVISPQTNQTNNDQTNQTNIISLEDQQNYQYMRSLTNQISSLESERKELEAYKVSLYMEYIRIQQTINGNKDQIIRLKNQKLYTVLTYEYGIPNIKECSIIAYKTFQVLFRNENNDNENNEDINLTFEYNRYNDLVYVRPAHLLVESGEIIVRNFKNIIAKVDT